MKRIQGLGTVVVAAALLPLLWSCSGERCIKARLPRDLPADIRAFYAAYNAESEEAEMTVCSIGQYEVVVRDEHGKESLIVSKAGKIVVVELPKGATLYADGVPVADVLPPTDAGAKSGLCYHGRDDGRGADVMVFDRNLDGQPEMRAWRYGDRRVETEYWFQDRWHPTVQRGGRRGILVRGKFVAVSRLNEELGTR